VLRKRHSVGQRGEFSSLRDWEEGAFKMSLAADSKRWEEGILEEESECPRPAEGTEPVCFCPGMTMKHMVGHGRKVGQTEGW